MDGKRRVRIVVMDDDAVVLHENDGWDLTRLFFHAAQLVADGEGQICAGVGVGHPAPGIAGSGKRLRRDRTAGRGAGGKIGIDAVRVHDKRFENRVKSRFDGRPQIGKAVNVPDVGFRAGRALFFHVRKLGRLGREIELAQIGAIQNGIRLVRTDIAQAEAGGLDRHQPAGQLDGRVAAAALHIVGACARSLGNAGKIGKQLCVFFKKHSRSPLTACSARRLRSA